MSVSLSSLPFGLPLTRATAFEIEERDLLLSRCRLLFGIGIAVGVVLIAFARIFIDRSIQFGSITSMWWVQLSTAIIFGLGFATILTLFVTPSALMIRENLRDWRERRRQRRGAEAAASESTPTPLPEAAE